MEEGGEGGGVYCGQGERTTETVSHTVPNMAAADQSPSIDCPEHLELSGQSNPISLFLSCPGKRGITGITYNRLDLPPSRSSSVIIHGKYRFNAVNRAWFAPEQELQG